MTKPEIFNLNDEVYCWIEQEAIHLKAVSGHTDPVELTEAQALMLAKKLQQFAEQLP